MKRTENETKLLIIITLKVL